jgi:hypothetical protein
MMYLVAPQWQDPLKGRRVGVASAILTIFASFFFSYPLLAILVGIVVMGGKINCGRGNRALSFVKTCQVWRMITHMTMPFLACS